MDLTEYGWTEPVDGSPFDLPDGWTGGSVTHTGGNIWCRIWNHPETNIEVIYNIGDPGVGVQQGVRGEGYDFVTELDENASTDEEKIEAARKYIQEEFDPEEIDD
jgi:hypothetical protein